MAALTQSEGDRRRAGSPLEVLAAFARLGVTCFGGPIAHLGYFRAEFVERRRWLDEAAFADLVGLCQFLPGPASSQTGFAIGLLRGGYLGGLAAWTGFTLPSAVLLLLFAYGAGGLAATASGAGVLHGLKLVAVAIVAQAIWGMARSLCPDRKRASIATVALILVLFAPTSIGQIAAIALGGVAGLFLCRPAAAVGAGVVPEPLVMPVSRGVGIGCLVLFAVLLLVAPLLRGAGMGIAVFDAFYRSGALVFGGGHVVLPLLRDAVVTPGWVSENSFLAGYGAAQAVPGPLFTFAAYLGAVISGPLGGVVGGIIALFAIFLPGILLLMGTLPFWDALRARPQAQAAMRGVNAAVVGLLGAALYNPVWTSAVLRPADFALAVLGFVLLVVWRVPPLLVVAIGALGGIGLGILG
ncbi:chromate efflux transporter [Rhodopila sp.]|uniref:chromate efflux transporter n=1 Tax=Rhodopila sp. TaxID=2480087 RepID=UPI003D13A14E